MDLNCYRTSNNKFFNAPPMMADGRNFTDYRPQCDVNNGLINENKLPNSHEYRMFLTQNAEKLMAVNTNTIMSKMVFLNVKNHTKLNYTS